MSWYSECQSIYCPLGPKISYKDIRMHGSSKSIVVGTSGVERKAKGNGDK